MTVVVCTMPQCQSSAGCVCGAQAPTPFPEDERAALLSHVAALEDALKDIALGRVPRMSKSGMFMVTAADHARAALKGIP